MDGRTHGQRENSIPPTNKVCGGYNEFVKGMLEHPARGTLEHYMNDVTQMPINIEC